MSILACLSVTIPSLSFREKSLGWRNHNSTQNLAFQLSSHRSSNCRQTETRIVADHSTGQEVSKYGLPTSILHDFPHCAVGWRQVNGRPPAAEEVYAERSTIVKCLVVTLLMTALLASGCMMSVTVKPDVPAGQVGFTLYGNIEYDGNRNYLPCTISDKVTGDSELVFKYAYNVLYGGTSINEELLAGFLPTTLIGTPTGKNDIQVRAKLDVFVASDPIKSYTSVCNILSMRSIFMGGTDLSAVRKKGLLAVKENIEHQMLQDREFWISYVNTIKGDMK